jgi:hypothetical protein
MEVNAKLTGSEGRQALAVGCSDMLDLKFHMIINDNSQNPEKPYTIAHCLFVKFILQALFFFFAFFNFALI